MTNSSADVTERERRGRGTRGLGSRQAARLRVEQAHAAELREAATVHTARLKRLAGELREAGSPHAARLDGECGRLAALLADIDQRYERSLAALDGSAPTRARPGQPATRQATLGPISNRAGRPSSSR
jgi:hypothetical protein